MELYSANKVLMLRYELLSEIECRLAIEKDPKEIRTMEGMKWLANHDIETLRQSFDLMGIDYDKKLFIKEL